MKASISAAFPGTLPGKCGSRSGILLLISALPAVVTVDRHTSQMLEPDSSR